MAIRRMRCVRVSAASAGALRLPGAVPAAVHGFLIAPLLYAFQISLFRETLVGGTRFVGFDNYVRAIHDKNFWDGVGLLFQFGLMQIPVMLGLALLFALILDSGLVFARSFFRVAFFIPYAVPAVIATLLWGYLYGPAFGPFSQLSEAMGFGKIDFLSGGGLLPSLANIAVWEYMGYNMIIYYAALQAVPRDLEEASAIDGATALQHSLRIKLPLIVPTIIVTVIFSIIGTLQLFTEPYLMRNLAPSQINSHYTPNYYAYTLAFISQQYNYSAAISFVLARWWRWSSYGFMLLTNRRRPPVTIAARTVRSAAFRRQRWLLTAVLGVYFVYTFIPLLYVIVSATKTNADLFGTFGLWFAGDFNLWENLQGLFTYQDGAFARWLLNTLPLRRDLRPRRRPAGHLRRLCLRQVPVPGQDAVLRPGAGRGDDPADGAVGAAVPDAVEDRAGQHADRPIILPSMVFPPGVFLMCVYIEDAVSNELIEAGRVDGAGELHIFGKIAFRLLMPGFATVLILAFVSTWNNYFLPLVMLNSSEYFPITVGLSQWYASATSGSGGTVLVHHRHGRGAGQHPAGDRRLPVHAALVAGRAGVAAG